MINLRSYQEDIFNKVMESLSCDLNPIVQLDTGAGKTPIIAEVCKNTENFIVIAHRNFLVRQASETLSKMGVLHNVLASKHTRNLCVVSALKHDINLTDSKCKIVASVDTLLSRKKMDRLFFDSEKEWIIIIDEAHHALDDNKWGALKRVLPFAKFVGFTATPMRTDGRSLDSESGGLFDNIIQADELKQNSVATLIQNGYLSDFKCYMTVLQKGLNRSDYDNTGGEKDLKTFEDKYILGEYVKYYNRLAKNKRAIVMCKSIAEAEEVADKFKEKGCSAMCISSKMTQAAVTRIIDDFKRGIVKILCNVAMVDEGFDVPKAECLIMLRSTNFRTYRQWVGRVLRPKKTPAIIIDHAENLVRHGLPDTAVNWKLNKERNYQNKLIDCAECGFVFYFQKLKCPECGHIVDIRDIEERIENTNIEIRKVMLSNLRRFLREEHLKYERIKMKEAHKYSLQVPKIQGVGLMFATINRLAHWFGSNMKDYVDEQVVTFENLNAFMKENFESSSFWLKNFTAKDLDTFNKKKCFEIYKKYGGKL